MLTELNVFFAAMKNDQHVNRLYIFTFWKAESNATQTADVIESIDDAEYRMWLYDVIFQDYARSCSYNRITLAIA